MQRPPWLQRITGGVNNLMGRLTGPADPNLNAQENAARQQQARMAMIGRLLQSAAPRPQGTVSPLADFGAAITDARQAGNAYSADALRAKLVQAQLAQSQQGGQDPSAVRTLVAAGIDPASPEGRDILVKSLSGGGVGDQLAAIQAQLAIEQRRDQIDRDRATDARTAEEDRVKKVQLGNTLKSGITQTANLAELTQKLEGSFLEAGMPASTWRRTGASVLAGTGAALGMDTRELERDIASFDKLKKGLSDQLINLMGSSDNMGQATNSKLTQYQNALATTETSPGAIMSIQAGIAQTLLEEADAQGIEISGRDAIEANIAKWRHYESDPAAAVVDVPAAARAVSDFSRMTVEQLSALDPAKMTPELLEAAKKRWEELHNAR